MATPARTYQFTERDRKEALDALYDLQELRQTIGKLGPMLSRTKPGTKRHQDYYDQITRLENEASALSSKVSMFIRLVNTSVPEGL
jgi:hypothetical protein